MSYIYICQVCICHVQIIHLHIYIYNVFTYRYLYYVHIQMYMSCRGLCFTVTPPRSWRAARINFNAPAAPVERPNSSAARWAVVSHGLWWDWTGTAAPFANHIDLTAEGFTHHIGITSLEKINWDLARVGQACNTTNGTGTCDGSMCVMCLGRVWALADSNRKGILWTQHSLLVHLIGAVGTATASGLTWCESVEKFFFADSFNKRHICSTFLRSRLLFLFAMAEALAKPRTDVNCSDGGGQHFCSSMWPTALNEEGIQETEVYRVL